MKFPPRTEGGSEQEALSWKALISIEEKNLPKSNRIWKKEAARKENPEAEAKLRQTTFSQYCLTLFPVISFCLSFLNT